MHTDYGPRIFYNFESLRLVNVGLGLCLLVGALALTIVKLSHDHSDGLFHTPLIAIASAFSCWAGMTFSLTRSFVINLSLAVTFLLAGALFTFMRFLRQLFQTVPDMYFFTFPDLLIDLSLTAAFFAISIRLGTLQRREHEKN